MEQDIVAGSVSPGVVDSAMYDAVAGSVQKTFAEPGESQVDFKAIAPDTVGAFASWLLCDTDKQYFAEKEWDIYDTFHHANWLGDREAPSL